MCGQDMEQSDDDIPLLAYKEFPRKAIPEVESRSRKVRGAVPSVPPASRDPAFGAAARQVDVSVDGCQIYAQAILFHIDGRQECVQSLPYGQHDCEPT